MRAITTLTAILDTWLTSHGWTWPDKAVVEPPRDPRFGDLATNLALVLSGQAKTKPRELAETMRLELADSSEHIASIEVAGPGFCNFTFTPSFWQQTVPAIHEAGDRYGSSTLGQGTRIQVEFVSANPTGPLHFGHGRGAAVGDSLTRILRFTGHEVGTEFYLNDAGRQMNLLGLSVWLRYQELCGMVVPLPDDFYRGDYIVDIAGELHDEFACSLLQQSPEVAVELCRNYAMTTILGDIRSDLNTFRVEHQEWFSEKSLLDSGAVERTFELLRSKGLAYTQEGALWFKSTRFGDDKDRVLRKSDGELTYFASDIAYHATKFERGFDRLVDVWGADHHGYVPRMKAAVQALGHAPEDLEVVLVQLVNLLRGGEQLTMSKRAGNFETLADVCAEVGVDAARFIFLSRKSDSPLDFDLEVARQQSMDNPVYYVQYAHARICSVKRKAREQGLWADPHDFSALDRLATGEDLALLKTLDRFPDVLAGCSRTMSPHHLSYYLQELAGELHRYYNTHPVLTAPDPETIQARLHLLDGVAQVVRNGLQLLGVAAPETM